MLFNFVVSAFLTWLSLVPFGSHLQDNHSNPMEKLSLAIHLGVLIGTFVFSAAALYALCLRSGRINSVLQLLSQPQTGITISKCADDGTLVVLLSLEVSPMISDGQ